MKKIDFDLSKYQICFVVFKKMVFNDKNSNMFCSIFFKKNDFLVVEKSDLFFLYVKKNEKDFSFKKRVSFIIWIYAIMN